MFIWDVIMGSNLSLEKGEEQVVESAVRGLLASCANTSSTQAGFYSSV